MVNARTFRARHVGRRLAAAIFAATCTVPLASYAADNASVFATQHMVSAANPFAARAGREILRRGGSAVDAAIAVQMVLNVVEPQSSGIGGGAFLLHYDSNDRTVQAYDGRETAPQAATEDMFVGPAGEPVSFYDAVVGGRSVGVPGLLRMLEAAHRDHGTLAWRDLFTAAITHAEQGFAVSKRLHNLLDRDKHLPRFSQARAYFYPDGEPLKIGAIRDNPALAETFRLIAAKGTAPFYDGVIAEAIVATIRNAPINPGLLTLDDLAGYKALERDALCRPYRQWRVCTMPPPTSGGVTLLQALGMLETFDLASLSPDSLKTVHLLAEALKRAYADRARYIADPDFVAIPVDGLLDPAYLLDRAREIDPSRASGKATAGEPKSTFQLNFAPAPSTELPSTSHISVIDRHGNAVTLTSSIENAFGSRLMTSGFLLNNQLTDFSFRPHINGIKIANRIEPLKRPRSSMAPTLVFDENKKLVLVLGTPGGSNIIAYMLQALVAILDQNQDIQQAVALPHHANRNGPIQIEADTALERLEYDLVRMDHEVVRVPMTSGLHGIAIGKDGLTGGVDPRREGMALGD
ncbi:MAG: gamma-glutamyltransferase [Rhodospirillaceae bacterium]|nr:gamma-glutamyltransferase [Rhodospirillaceae bacterium]